MPTRSELANALRALAIDAVEQAASGHPGAPMGMLLHPDVPAVASRFVGRPAPMGKPPHPDAPAIAFGWAYRRASMSQPLHPALGAE